MANDFQPSARVIADSISPDGHRLTTLEVQMHRFVLAEFNTHRALSRNSASSRAIPVARTFARLADHPAVPVVWAREQKGMQGGACIDDPAKAREIWLAARDAAVAHAEELLTLGVHKSIVNRVLEPFLDHTVVVSATDWDGFLQQRCSPLAQPEMRAAAEAMREALHASLPLPLRYGDWHLPYLTPIDIAEIGSGVRQQVSAARCARVSYLTQDGRRSPLEDIDLYNRLTTANPPHWSPLEHVATPAQHTRPAGNFTGWHQLRHHPFGTGLVA